MQKSRRRQPANSATANTPKIDRLPPSSTEAEQGVLGCVLLSPNDCLGECIEKLKPGPEVFYDLRHQTLFQTLVEMYDERAGIDLITLHQRLKDRQQLEGVGGLAYLASLPDAVPSAAGLDYYLDIVLEKYLLRKMIQTCTSIVGRVYRARRPGGRPPGRSGARHLPHLRRARRRGQPDRPRTWSTTPSPPSRNTTRTRACSPGIGTGFADFDKMTTGLHEGEMIVIAARPSVGKTSLAMNIAEHVALELKVPTGVFSLEMTADQLVLRMLCSRSRVNLRSIRDGFLAERDFPKLTGAAGKLAAAPAVH